MITADELREQMQIKNADDIEEIMSTLEDWILKAAKSNYTSVEAYNLLENIDDKLKALITSLLISHGYQVTRRTHSKKRYCSFFISW